MSQPSSLTLNLLPSPLFLLGPAHSGKSELAIQAMDPERSTTVIGTATLAPLEERLQVLKSLRPSHWMHREGCPLNETLRDSLEQSDQVLIDSINQWLANHLLESWNRYDFVQHEARVALETRVLCETLSLFPQKRIVIVSSEVGAGVTPPQDLARVFRQLLGTMHRALAAQSSTVVEVMAGIPRVWK